MKKPEIARQLARQSGVTPAEAADRLDNLVRQILDDLKHGQQPELPGLGRFRVGRARNVVFHRDRLGSRP